VFAERIVTSVAAALINNIDELLGSDELNAKKSAAKAVPFGIAETLVALLVALV
jgi:hypothetical protein